MMKLRMIPARKAIAPSTRQMFIITLFPGNAREDIRMTIPNIMTPTQIQAFAYIFFIFSNSHSIRYPFTTKSLPIIRKALFLTVDRHVLVPVFLLFAEHKHYVVITEQSEVVQVNADIKSERLP